MRLSSVGGFKDVGAAVRSSKFAAGGLAVNLQTGVLNLRIEI